MPDIFPDSGFIDIAGTEGDEIVHLESYGEELLIFKKREMQVADISELDNEKVIAVFSGMGINNYRHVCKTPHGIIWANPQGVWQYKTGETTLKNLLSEEGIDKISGQKWREQTEWDKDITSSGNVQLGYSLENDKLLIILSTIPNNGDGDYPYAGDTLIYHFGTSSWSFGRSGMPQSTGEDEQYCSNMITDYNVKLLMAGLDVTNTTGAEYLTENDAATHWNGKWWGRDLVDTTYENTWETPANESRIVFWHWDEAHDGFNAQDIPQGKLEYKSKDFTFDKVGAKKTFYKLYITYRCGISSTNLSDIKVTYRVDGGNTDYHFTAASTFNDKLGNEVCYDAEHGLKETGDGYGNGKFRTAELKVANRDQARKINSIQICLSNPNGTVTKNGLNIDDITFVYKEHPTK